MKIQLATKAGMKRAGVLLGVCAAIVALAWWICIRMPGRSYHGPRPVLTERETRLAASLRADVEVLAGRIGDRSFETYAGLSSAGRFVAGELNTAGYTVAEESFDVDGQPCTNYVAEIAGAGPDAASLVVVGAHYDTAVGPGADDNASGTAMLLALGRAFAQSKPKRTLRFVAFTNEEPPHFWTENMGSLVHAKALRARNADVIAMLSLESVGVFSDAKGSQKYPRPFSALYPDTGNFVGFVGNVSSRKLTRRVVGTFRANARIPSQGAALPAARVIGGQPVGLQGVDWSDHWSFWQMSYPALMVSDTAVFRNTNYHDVDDTPEKLDYESMALTFTGLEAVVRDLAGIE